MTVGSTGVSVRPDLEDLEPYVSPQRPARFRMNTNESPHPPPPALVEEVIDGLRTVELNRYPDKDARRLRTRLAEHADWAEDGLWIANGSNEVLMHLFLAFGGGGRSALTFEPTYSLHSIIPRIAGTQVVSLRRAETFEIDVESAVDAVREHRPEIVMVCSPNNPTGHCEPVATVRALLETTSGLVVVDEAYGEFADPGDSVAPLLAEHTNLVVVKTFSKAWRLAGVRAGYLVADPAIVSDLDRVGLPYHLSTFTQLAAEAALRHRDESLAAAQEVAAQRDRIAVELGALGLKTYPSKANFVLFEVDDPSSVWEALLARGVLVRSYAGRPGLARCLRVTAGLPEETDAFLSAMGEVLG